jgi:Ribosomal protein L7/L12 C-terminal domain
MSTKLQLANVVSWAAGTFGRSLMPGEITRLDQILTDNAPDQPNLPLISHRQMLAMFEYMATGRKIEAIKEYRTLTGVGLKEAKDAVEVLTSVVKVR